MKKILVFAALLLAILPGCRQNHDHENTPETEHPKIQLTAYSDDFELFAEADPFISGKTSNVLSHFTILPGFEALEYGKITIRLEIDGQAVTQTLEEPTRKGIYSFDIIPGIEGEGELIFDIENDHGIFLVTVPGIRVFSDENEAFTDAHSKEISGTNTIVFTKEQSWKIDFATEQPGLEAFGQLIKTSAQIQSAQSDEVLITAKTNGNVIFSTIDILEGKEVISGQDLFTISGSGLADDNLAVQLAEARNNYHKAKADYDRMQELLKEKIVSEKDFLVAKNQYENAKVVYENLEGNFSSGGQRVISPITGFITQTHVQSGQFVELGQALIVVSKNKTLLLRAEIQPKYVGILSDVITANIRTIHDDQTYTLEQLNGMVLSYGRNTNTDNYLIPVILQIDNPGDFLPGGYVELYLKTVSNTRALTVPNSAILEEQGVFFVFVQVTPELFEKREVHPGATDGLKTEIISGIDAHERIVTKGAILIKLAKASGALDAHSGHVH